MTYAITPTRRSRHCSLAPPRWLWLAPALLLPLAIKGPNTDLALYAVAVLALGLRLLWRPGEPPILLFIFFYQWMQSATGALYGNVIGVPIADVSYSWGRHAFASGLMLTGVMMLALAMRVVAGRPRPELHERMKAVVLAKPFKFWVRVYVITWVFSAACEVIAPMAGGLRLPFVTISEVKWAGFFLLTFAAFISTNPSNKIIWALFFLFEFLISIGGFFSSFKEVFFFTLFALAAVSVRLRPRILIPGALLAVMMIGLGIVWTAIKMEYRFLVNRGSGQQAVLLDYGDRISELGRLVSNLDGSTLEVATDALASRVMYHSFFGAVAERVPSGIPHAAGDIWFEAISRPLMPRLLFPNKRAINDSDLTNEYTGLGVATAEQGTSISLGYMAEAYIDFGPIFMFLPIMALGAVVGAFYRWLLRQPGYKAVVGASLAPIALMPAHLAETSILKMIPSLFLTLLACIVVIKLLAPMVLRGLSRANLGDRV